jgi:hypothetical protein
MGANSEIVNMRRKGLQRAEESLEFEHRKTLTESSLYASHPEAAESSPHTTYCPWW